MRLSLAESESIVSTVKKFIKDEFRGELLLFGSQTRPDAKGGDIDLVLVVDMQDEELKNYKMQDYKIVAAMKQNKAIGDRKIDFKVLSKKESEIGFFKEALKGAVSLFVKPEKL